MTDDFYRLLGVPEDASQTDIRAAFRHKVQEYHPDHNDDPRATAQFTALKMAYDTLNDEEERQAYDRLGHEEYVAERLDGLPDPEQWPSTDDPEASGRRGGSSHSQKSNSTTTDRQSGGTSRQTTASAGTNGQGRSHSNTGTRTTTDGGGTATSRTTSQARSRQSTGRTREEPSRVLEWLFRNDTVQWLVGWRLLYLSVLLYLAGVTAYAVEQGDAVMTALDRLIGTGDLLASRGELISMSEFLIDGIASFAPAALLFALGIVCYPAVVFVLVSITRRTPGWRPTLLYVVAALMPVFGVLTGLVTPGSTLPLIADLVVFLLLPVGAFLAMLFSANVRPILKKRFGLDG